MHFSKESYLSLPSIFYRITHQSQNTLCLSQILQTPVCHTETTEHIFSSSIETINTIGNVLFTENVARLYQLRGLYKSSVCDSLASTSNQDNPIYSVKRTLDIPYSFYALLSHELLTDMQQRYAICKQLMDVTDEEIEVYRKEREALEGSLADDKVTLDAVAKEISQLQTEIDTLKAKLKLEDN